MLPNSFFVPGHEYLFLQAGDRDRNVDERLLPEPDNFPTPGATFQFEFIFTWFGERLALLIRLPLLHFMVDRNGFEM